MEFDLDVFINPDEFGAPAVYTPDIDDPVIEDAVLCNVVVEHDVVLQPSNYDARVVETGTTIEALYRDVASPMTGSTFLVDDIKYRVERVTDNDREFVTMVVSEEKGW